VEHQPGDRQPKYVRNRILKRSIKHKKERPLCLWHRNSSLPYAQPSTNTRCSAAVRAGSHHLRFPDVIPVTRIAIGSALPEQSLSPWSSGTGFPSGGELAHGMREIVKTANAAALPAKGQWRTSHNLRSLFVSPQIKNGAVISTVAGGRRLPCWCSFSTHHGKLSFRCLHSLVFTEVLKNKQADRRG
jgi:hypothetical protein